MYDFAILAFAVIAAVAAVLGVLPLLGYDIRIRGRHGMPLAPTESKRTKKAWLALAVALFSLGLSAGAFYYFFRPHITTKIVERLVEKQVPVPCPDQQPSIKPETHKQRPHIGKTPVLPPGITRTPVADCPPNTRLSVNAGSMIAEENGKCGIYLEGDVCLKVQGEMYLYHNEGGGLCVDSKGNVTPDTPKVPK